MSADVKIKTIAQVYDAFGRGDVAAILDAVTDDVDWAAETTSAAAPWYGVRHGKDADVLSVVRCRARSRSTGKTLAMDLHHYFKFRDGKIAY